MADILVKPTGRINRRNPANEGDRLSEPLVRENLLVRDGRITQPKGTEKLNTTALSDRFRWLGRYYTIETGSLSPKTFASCKDGKFYLQDDQSGTHTLLPLELAQDTYPKSISIKVGNQTNLYLCDGVSLYKHDGNNDHKFEKISISFNPFDLEEHLDRLCAIDDTIFHISKNFEFDNFTDSTDAIDIIVGSGKGKNLALVKLESSLYVFTTEGIFRLVGDTISAVAETFEIRLINGKKGIVKGSIYKDNRGILFVACDHDNNYELYSFNGSDIEMLSYKEKLSDYVNPYRVNQMCATYYNGYYQCSFVEKGYVENNMEIWWDALENKCEFVRGRNVGIYFDTEIDTSKELAYQQFGRSDANFVMWAERGRNFDGAGIVKKLQIGDITPKKFEVVRFTDFYFDIEPTGDRSMLFRYLIDGRLSDLGGLAADLIDLEGEHKALGYIKITNQRQNWVRVQPKIKYSRGTSVSLEFIDSTINMEFTLLSIGINFVEDKG